MPAKTRLLAVFETVLIFGLLTAGFHALRLAPALRAWDVLHESTPVGDLPCIRNRRILPADRFETLSIQTNGGLKQQLTKLAHLALALCAKLTFRQEQVIKGALLFVNECGHGCNRSKVV